MNILKHQSQSSSKSLGKMALMLNGRLSPLAKSLRNGFGWLVFKLAAVESAHLPIKTAKKAKIGVANSNACLVYLVAKLKNIFAGLFFFKNKRQIKLNAIKVIPGHKSSQPISAKGMMLFTLIKRIVTEWCINIQPGSIKMYPVIEKARLIFNCVLEDRFCKANDIKILHAQIITARGLNI
jgi:hypothetical protein